MWIKDHLLFLCYHPGIYLLLIKFPCFLCYFITSDFVRNWYDLRCNTNFDLICPDWLSWFYVMTYCHDSMIGKILWTFLWRDGTLTHAFYGGTVPLPMLFMEGRHPCPWFFVYDCYGGTAPLPMILIEEPVTCKSYDFPWGTWNCNSYDSPWGT